MRNLSVLATVHNIHPKVRTSRVRRRAASILYRFGKRRGRAEVTWIRYEKSRVARIVVSYSA